MKKNEKLVEKLVDELFYYDHETGVVKNKIHRNHNALKDHATGYLHEGYLNVEINNKPFMVHRIAWRLYYKKWPKKQIDHINGNRSDNRICNLRDVSNRENQLNRKEHRNGKIIGFSYVKEKKKYKAQICINKKQYYLGYYKTEIEAHEQYLRALKAIETSEFKSAKELRDYLASTNERAKV